MNKLQYKIHRHIALLSSGDNNEYLKQLTLTSWGNKQPRLDVRTWRVFQDGHQEPLKGLSLSIEEAATLRDALINLKMLEGVDGNVTQMDVPN